MSRVARTFDGRAPMVSAFLTLGFSCVYEPTANGKQRINRGCHSAPPEESV